MIERILDWRGTGSTLALPLLLGLSACAVAPVYQAPVPGLDAGFVGPGATLVNSEPAAEDIARFWRGFNDATLTALVERGLAANGDVRIALARLQEARALQGEAQAAGRPGVGLDGGVTRATRPITQQPGASRSDRTSNTFDVGFVAAWELDLFGRLRLGNEAAAARADAVQASLYAAHTSVVAEIARYYMELRGMQQQQRIAEAALVNQREVLRLTELRVAAGRGTQLDVVSARSLVTGTQAVLPAMLAGIERLALRIATLVARAPRDVLAELAAPAPLPGLPVTDLSRLPVGTPAQWLLRRPDLAAAERALAAATAEAGVAMTERFPRVSLSGLLGLNAASFGGLLRAESAVYSLGAGLSWTPFDQGGIESRIGASQARVQQALARYEQALAIALEETEAAMSNFTRNAQRGDQQVVAAGYAAETARLVRLRYQAGVSDLSPVLDAERQALASEDALIQARTATATALVAVYRALGGGWTAP